MPPIAITMPTIGVWTWSSSRDLLSTYQRTKMRDGDRDRRQHPRNQLVADVDLQRPMVPD